METTSKEGIAPDSVLDVASESSIPPPFSGDVLALLAAGKLVAFQAGSQWRLESPGGTRHLERGSTASPSAKKRNISRWWSAALLLAGLVFGARGLYGQSVPGPASSVIPYQGYLEEDGVPAEGQRFATACLYRTAESTDCVWTESHFVEVSAGRFSMSLGSDSSLDAVMRDGGNLYLGLTIDAASKGVAAGQPVALAGKQLIGSTPYARRGAPGKDFSVDGVLSVNAASTEQVVPTGLQNASSTGSVLWYEGDLKIKTGQVGAAGDRVTVRANGNVGIGAANPRAKLDVAGDAVTGFLARKLARASGTNAADMGQGVGAVPGRTLTFVKLHADTSIHVSYTDILRTIGFSNNNYGCRWEIKFNGQSCPTGALSFQTFVYAHVPGIYWVQSINHEPHTLEGVCEASSGVLGPGTYEITFEATSSVGVSQAGCYAGLYESRWTLQAEEVF